MKSNILTIIIPTLAEKKREKQIKKCISSVRESITRSYLILVIVNGDRFDEKLLSWIKNQRDISLDYAKKASLPCAIARGRELVETPFFSFLDDDDIYLTGTFDDKIDIMNNNPNIDVVVSNGYIIRDGIKRLLYNDMENIKKDPIGSLLKSNWLASCGGLYRRDSFDNDFFNNYHKYSEWTWFAFQLAMYNKNIEVYSKPSFLVNDTLGSLSKTYQYKQSRYFLYEKMLSMKPPKRIKKMIKIKIGAYYHENSDFFIQKGRYFDSMKYHIKSIFTPEGYKYILNTRKYFKKIS